MCFFILSLGLHFRVAMATNASQRRGAGASSYAVATADRASFSVKGGPPPLLSPDGVRLDGRPPQETRAPCKFRVARHCKKERKEKKRKRKVQILKIVIIRICEVSW